MRFQTPLVPARLVQRYKRFLIDATLEDGTEVTAHCANPGSMLGLALPGSRIWLEPNDDPKKKLKYGWRLIEHETGHFTGVDTSVPNRALKEYLGEHGIPEFADYTDVRPEVKYGQNSRIDFLLSAPDRPNHYLEVKSVTLSRNTGVAEFPDSVTARGTKHLAELIDMKALGHDATMLYLVQRTDAELVSLADDIDPKYAEAFERARTAGVNVLAYRCQISPEEIEIDQRIPFL
ncbi:MULTISPECIES: DNA/RNA nuclease SfsA [unclassified Shimia]|uniref:DNA/RNA nuclease SfsA n=1 Tax=unclassified Shimia TaxID=2630038 RepID=UPI003107B018